MQRFVEFKKKKMPHFTLLSIIRALASSYNAPGPVCTEGRCTVAVSLYKLQRAEIYGMTTAGAPRGSLHPTLTYGLIFWGIKMHFKFESPISQPSLLIKLIIMLTGTSRYILPECHPSALSWLDPPWSRVVQIVIYP